jgi:predicted MFS family arabinose efflux permease
LAAVSGLTAGVPDDPPAHWAQPAPRHPGAWPVFAILFALMVVDFIDRQVVVSVFPHLKSAWRLSDTQLGALVSVISTVVGITTVPLSLLADRWGHVRSIFAMALVWSVATIACAFARDYRELLVARGFVGLGEAAYGPVGAALLARLFPMRMRSTVLGGFLAAAVVGSVLGVALGAFVAERWGWHASFGVAGLPGLLLAVVFVACMRRYDRVAAPDAADAAAARLPAARVIAAFLEPRSAIVTCVASGFQLVTVWAVYAWLPSYLNRFHGFAPDRAGAQTAVVVLLGGVGAVLWGIVADRLALRRARARLYVPAIAAAATGCILIVAFTVLSPGPAQFATLLAAALIMTGTVGPCTAVVMDVVRPAIRATAASVLTITGNLLGSATGPLLAGALSDAYGLDVSLAAMPLFSFVAAAGLMVAARTYVADLARVPGGCAGA